MGDEGNEGNEGNEGKFGGEGDEGSVRICGSTRASAQTPLTAAKRPMLICESDRARAMFSPPAVVVPTCTGIPVSSATCSTQCRVV
jgi:hypothetical protein